MDDKEFWEREARIMQHQADRHAYRAARIEALFSRPPEEKTMPGVTKENIDHWFTYHPPTNSSQKELYERLREAGKEMALTILQTTPSCADQTVAIRRVREAVMIANAAIACDGK